MVESLERIFNHLSSLESSIYIGPPSPLILQVKSRRRAADNGHMTSVAVTSLSNCQHSHQRLKIINALACTMFEGSPNDTKFDI